MFRRIFSRKILSKIVSFVSKVIQFEKKSILAFICIVMIIAIAVAIRMLPLEWGFNLSEFDPYYQYTITRHIADNGLFSWNGWHMDDVWFPVGRDVAYSSFPAFPMTGAALHFVISSLGVYVSVLDVCIIFPVIFAAITCIVMYLLGKDLGGRGVGLLAALFLALSPAYIGRTTLGFYDDETVGIFGILLTSFFYLRSLKPDQNWRTSLVYSMGAGVGLGYVSASWGASRYLLALLALYSFILFVTKRYTPRLLISFSVLLAIGLAIAVAVPRLGFRYIQELEVLATIGIGVILALYEVSQRLTGKRRKWFFGLSLLGLGGLAFLLNYFGVISLPGLKFLSVINPFQRLDIPLIQSVQEHRPATWASFYYQFGILVFLAPLGIILTFQRIDYRKIFLITYALTALYFSASMIRLTIITASALCILGGIAITELLQPFINIALSRVSRRRVRFYARVGKPFSILLIIIFFTLILFPTLRGIDSAYAPTTIAASSIPIRAQLNDWGEALTWMKESLPRETVVLSWWDYGYWINVRGEKITLADNGTINGTQIAWIGRFLMSTEEEAMTMLNNFNGYSKNQFDVDNQISHVVVFTTIGLAQQGQILYGDEVKWRWMAQIGGLDDAALEDTSVTQQIAEYWAVQSSEQYLLQWYDSFARIAIPKNNTILTKLMINGVYPNIFLPQPQFFQLDFASSNKLVFVYKVLYE